MTETEVQCTCGRSGQFQPGISIHIPMPHKPDCPKSWRRAIDRMSESERAELVRRLEETHEDEAGWDMTEAEAKRLLRGITECRDKFCNLRHMCEGCADRMHEVFAWAWKPPPKAANDGCNQATCAHQWEMRQSKVFCLHCKAERPTPEEMDWHLEPEDVSELWAEIRRLRARLVELGTCPHDWRLHPLMASMEICMFCKAERPLSMAGRMP